MTSVSELNDILILNKYVVIKYSADICKPCKEIMPEYEKLKEDYGNHPNHLAECVKFVEIDYKNMSKELLNDDIFGIKKIPNIKTFIEGTKVCDVIGLEAVKKTRECLEFERHPFSKYRNEKNSE